MNVSPKEIHDGLIMARVYEHFENSKLYFPESRIVGIFCQDSQNYGLDYEKSDVDTKLIVTPTFEDIAFNKKPISTTHILEKEEHVDWKDIRLYMNTFIKQSINSLEILLTNLKIINPMYQEPWSLLEKHREEIARMNPYRAVKGMKGIAMKRYQVIEYEYPGKNDILTKQTYDPKPLYHLLRIEEFIKRYVNGEPYEDCLRSCRPERLIEIKRGLFILEDVPIMANIAITNITRIADNFCAQTEDRVDEFAQPIHEIFVDNADRIGWYDDWKTVFLKGVGKNGQVWEFSPSVVGKTVLLTREEAEEALRRDENG